MDETLRQIGELLLGSIPTIIFFLLLYGLYTLLVHRPMSRVLEQRRERTQGALTKAQADVAWAEERAAEYERRLREARLEIFKAQEARRTQAAQERSRVLADIRHRAQAQLEAARVAIEQDTRAAKTSLETEAARLAADIIRAALDPALAESRAGGR